MLLVFVTQFTLHEWLCAAILTSGLAYFTAINEIVLLNVTSLQTSAEGRSSYLYSGKVSITSPKHICSVQLTV
jgi:hypothetical protein